MLDIANRPLDVEPSDLLRAGFAATTLADGLSFSKTPVRVSSEYVENLRTLSVLLDTALRAVVARYHEDFRIRDIYALDPALDALLGVARGSPYAVGLYRPDFVYDLDGHPRICEIGARYPLNGWMVSRAATRSLAEALASVGLREVCEQDAPLLDALRALHPPGTVLAMLHGCEPGTELFCLRDELAAHGVEFLQAHPSALRCSGGALAIDGRRIDRIVLEMDRTELVDFQPDALARMIDEACYFNDVRTLILVHDKRVLAVLNDEAIMRDCMAADAYAALRRYLIPTWVVHDDHDARVLQSRPHDLIAKPSSGGRGVDTCVRSLCDPAAWARCMGPDRGRYVFQEYIGQYTFREPGSGAPIHLVGMQLCRDRHSHGPGIFRGSDEAVINVHQGRGCIYATGVAA
ncbi:MAG: hypothetical protein M3Q42_11080 [Pseudomonadota bacterium]|nr:hypothetical protein [Pseudomonadota bacterium]